MKHRILLSVVSSILALPLFAQTVKTTWLDDSRKEVPMEQATMRVEIEMKGKMVYRTAYQVKPNQLITKGLFKDTSWRRPVGTHLLYDSTGYLRDSAVYDEASRKIFAVHYYPSGKEYMRYQFDPATNKESVLALDESGKTIPDFIYEREAEFPGGTEGWKKHLMKHVRGNVPVKNNAKEGMYTVIVRFIVNKDGSITDIFPETSKGYGMEEEAVRVMRLSPKWKPAIQYNRPVNAYRRQPISFVVSK